MASSNRPIPFLICLGGLLAGCSNHGASTGQGAAGGGSAAQSSTLAAPAPQQAVKLTAEANAIISDPSLSPAQKQLKLSALRGQVPQ